MCIYIYVYEYIYTCSELVLSAWIDLIKLLMHIGEDATEATKIFRNIFQEWSIYLYILFMVMSCLVFFWLLCFRILSSQLFLLLFSPTDRSIYFYFIGFSDYDDNNYSERSSGSFLRSVPVRE
jgi:TRAP-type C4-dicarboxylate transport system permease large subunit